MKRQIEETEKIKNLYSEHNRAKLDEVLVLKLKQRLALTNEIVLDDTEEEISILPELTDEMKVWFSIATDVLYMFLYIIISYVLNCLIIFDIIIEEVT